MRTALQILLPGICYFLFNWQFFRCSEAALKAAPIRRWSILWTFLLNESVFVLCSLAGFHLIANWLIFLILMLIELIILYRLPFQESLLLSLLGTMLGLAVNILFRSLLSILFHLPLIMFDNNSTPDNMKSYPILLGFLFVAALFKIVRHYNLLKNLESAIQDKSTLGFLLGLLIAMYFYLCINLLVYSVADNNFILKLWSMKSSVFVIIGECLSVILSIQLGQIRIFRAESYAAKEQLVQEKKKEMELRTIAATDPLTGCVNRQQADLHLQEALVEKRKFCLCFVDINKLKSVNDTFGHEAGDQYIRSVAKVLGKACLHNDLLFRYGGDEFLLMLFDTTVPDASARLQLAQQQLREEYHRHACAFPMNFCYGISSSEDGSNPLELIHAADERMYQMKRSMSTADSNYKS